MLCIVLVFLLSLSVGAVLFSSISAILITRSAAMLVLMIATMGFSAFAWLAAGQWIMGDFLAFNSSPVPVVALLAIGNLGVGAIVYLGGRNENASALAAFIGGTGGLGGVTALCLLPPPAMNAGVLLFVAIGIVMAVSSIVTARNIAIERSRSDQPVQS